MTTREQFKAILDNNLKELNGLLKIWRREDVPQSDVDTLARLTNELESARNTVASNAGRLSKDEMSNVWKVNDNLIDLKESAKHGSDLALVTGSITTFFAAKGIVSFGDGSVGFEQD